MSHDELGLGLAARTVWRARVGRGVVRVLCAGGVGDVINLV